MTIHTRNAGPLGRRYVAHCDYCRHDLPGHHGHRESAEAALQTHLEHAHGRKAT